VLRLSFKTSKHDWKIVSTRRAFDASAGKRQADQMNVKSQALLEYDFHVVLN
jgi:hypothetical protein